MRYSVKMLPVLLVLAIPALAQNQLPRPSELRPVVEAEEDVYQYEPLDNGSGPLWCSGSTCLVRVGEKVFASGVEKISDAKPLNNCRWTLFQRGTHGWERLRAGAGRTRNLRPWQAVRTDGCFCRPIHAGNRSREVQRPGKTGDSSVLGFRCHGTAQGATAGVGRHATVYRAQLS